MRTIWGSVQGERFWNMLRGNDIKEITTKTSTIGHSHVLHPSWRKPDLAKHILNRLVLKAASRLRRKRYFCKKIKIHIKIKSGCSIEGKKKFNKINDSITLLEQSDLTWKEILISNKIKRIKQVSVVLYDYFLKRSLIFFCIRLCLLPEAKYFIFFFFRKGNNNIPIKKPPI